MKKILGLDLGTNSIGWAVVCHSDTDGQTERKWIEMAGSRIIPMDAAILGDFDKGNSKSQREQAFVEYVDCENVFCYVGKDCIRY